MLKIWFLIGTYIDQNQFLLIYRSNYSFTYPTGYDWKIPASIGPGHVKHVTQLLRNIITQF